MEEMVIAAPMEEALARSRSHKHAAWDNIVLRIFFTIFFFFFLPAHPHKLLSLHAYLPGWCSYHHDFILHLHDSFLLSVKPNFQMPISLNGAAPWASQIQYVSKQRSCSHIPFLLSLHQRHGQLATFQVRNVGPTSYSHPLSHFSQLITNHVPSLFPCPHLLNTSNLGTLP